MSALKAPLNLGTSDGSLKRRREYGGSQAVLAIPPQFNLGLSRNKMKKLLLSALFAATCAGALAGNYVRIPNQVAPATTPSEPPPAPFRPSMISVSPYTFEFKGSMKIGEFVYSPITVSITGNTSVTFGKVSAVGTQGLGFLATTTAPSLTRPCVGTFPGGDTCQVFAMYFAQEASSSPRTAILHLPNSGTDAQGQPGPQESLITFEGTVLPP